MDIIGNYNFESFSSMSTSFLEVPDQSSSTSDNGSSYGKSNFSDEEVIMLASNNPKRRAGRNKFRETRHPVYRGIRKRNSDKWVCEVREPKKKSRIWLGTFQTAEMAARAHDVAVIALRGRSACLNFADSAWRLPIPASKAAKDIQKAAVEAAEKFRPIREIINSEKSIVVEEAIEDVIVTDLPDNVLFMDEDAFFCMPGLLADMAEGLMLPPPQCIDGFGGIETEVDISLWSY